MSGAMIAAMIVMAAALLAGVPAVFAMLSAVVIIALAGGADIAELTSYGFLEIGSLMLLAIPMLIFVKIIMERCGVGERLIDYGRSRIMPQANDTEDAGKIWTALVSNVSMAGIILPPGIALLLYAFAGGQSIAACFAAVIVPAIILLLLFFLVTKGMVIIKQWQQQQAERNAEAAVNMERAGEPEMDAVEAAMTTAAEDGEDGDEDDEEDEDEDDDRSIVPAIIAPILILAGIFSGFVTLMEAAAVAVIYIILMGWFFYQEMDWEDLKEVLIETGTKAGNILLTVFASMLLSRLFIMENVPQIMVDGLSSMSESRGVLVICLILMMIVAGLLTDRNSAILLVTPVIVQVALSVGVNPIQFAGITVLSIGMGCMILSRPAKTNLLFILLAWLPTLLLTVYIPQISLFLPITLGYL